MPPLPFPPDHARGASPTTSSSSVQWEKYEDLSATVSFDGIIIDEAGQAIEGDALAPLRLAHSLRALPEFREVAFDFTAAPDLAKHARKTLFQSWSAGAGLRFDRPRPELLILGPGQTFEETINLWTYVERPPTDGECQLSIELDLPSGQRGLEWEVKTWSGKIQSNVIKLAVGK